jgi:hypothetical protein
MNIKIENNDQYIPFIQHINESGTSIIEGTRENSNVLYSFKQTFVNLGCAGCTHIFYVHLVT